ncbi:MAG: hypothetical protein ACYCZ1_02505 [Candidatus Humimicrobiaceae bacterium]
MSIFVQKYKNFESTNINHYNNLIDWGVKELDIAINLADFPKMPLLTENSPSWIWRGYINHLFTFMPDGMHAWTFDGRQKAFWSSYKNENMAAAFKLCKKLNWKPIVMFSHAEEQNSWLTRAPSQDKWLYLRRFSKEFARYLKEVYGFADASLEPWNEFNECGSANHYCNVAVNLAIGWLEIYPKAQIHVGGVDIKQEAYLNAILLDKPLMQRATHLSPHILTVEEWESDLINQYYNKTKAIGKKLSMLEVNPVGRWDLMNKLIGKVTHYAPVLLIRNDIVGNSNEFSECLIYYLSNPNSWQVIHSENIKKIKDFSRRAA